MNSRCHSLHTEKVNILNREFKQQYENFLRYLIEIPKLTSTHYLCLLYYLLIQDRINDAINIYQKINSKDFENSGMCQIQYDYCSAYLDFYIGFPNFKIARNICENYLDYPVIQWRNLFYEIANHLAEFDGEELVTDKTEQTEKKKKNVDLAENEEILNTFIEGKKIVISYQNVEEVLINLYKIDIEVLFSRTPFLQNESGDFSFVKPNYSFSKKFEKSKTLEKFIFEIPEEFEKNNVSIMIRSENLHRSLNYFASSLQVQIIENYGQIRVLDQNSKPLSKVYIKAFSKKKSGEISFYKDGYTDLIGRFDYATINSSSINQIEKFSLLIMSDELGCVIKDAQAPSYIGKFEKTVELKAKTWQLRADNKRQVKEQIYFDMKKKTKK